jgi:hypothetical protein
MAAEEIARLLQLTPAETIARKTEQEEVQWLIDRAVKTLPIYRMTWSAGTHLLTWNYDLAVDDCASLMPFDFQSEGLYRPGVLWTGL